MPLLIPNGPLSAKATYSLCGLTFEVSQPLPGLGLAAIDARPPDVRVELGGLPSFAGETAAAPWYVSPYRDAWQRPPMTAHLVADGAFLHLVYHDRVEFVVDRGGSRIWAAWPATTALTTVVSYLLSPILALTLRLRRLVCLHASAVAVNGRALLFLGRSQSGKSTIAAWLAAKGHRVLADDVVALDETEHGLVVRPAYPWLRLQRSTALALLDLMTPRPRLASLWDEDYLDLPLDQPGFAFANAPLPVGGVFVIERTDDSPLTPNEPLAAAISRRERPDREWLSSADALVALLASAWGSGLVDRDLRAEEFNRLSALAAAAPTRRLSWDGRLISLDEVCGTIESSVSARINPVQASPAL